MNEEDALTQMVGWEPDKFKPPNKTFIVALNRWLLLWGWEFCSI